MTDADSILAVEGLGVRYGRRQVLDGVSFALPRGSVFALLGRNGAGKSSLIRCVLGLQKPDAGGARLFGADAWANRRTAMQRTGVVPEEPNAPPEMTARQLIDFCGRLYPSWNTAQAEARLQRFGVPRDQAFGRLSKGQKGAVMLSLALAPSPELLILDDPTLGLDVVARRALFDELIGELAERGTTVLITTHDLAGIEGIADRVAILRGHQLVLDEGVETLKDRFRRLRCGRGETVFAWSPFEALRADEREWGREAVVSNYDEARLAAFSRQPGIGDVEVGSLTLEEIFLAVDGAGARS
jgi:ABC-2 type transport system ATP-binding protein